MQARILLTSLLLLAGCPYISDDEAADRRDLDGDGLAAFEAGGTDCDDQSNTVGVLEWWIDSDGDGFGDNGAEPVEGCEPPGDGDYVQNAADCDDGDSAINPEATEVCNELDDDCDGNADLGASQTWYRDADEDGFGDASDTFDSCTPPSGYISDSQDCDDTLATVHPDGIEICNDIDDDCDGAVDDADDDTTGQPSWYTDGDGDGFGDPATEQLLCTQPSDTIAQGGDCDDASTSVKPGQPEVCNGVDDDCDGLTDDDDDQATGQTTWYIDADADGYGEATVSVLACAAPAGYVGDDTDCDDIDGAVSPGALEVCNGIDDDCDGSVDPNSSDDAGSWYVDADLDGFGNPASGTVACNAPAGFIADGTDCDDTERLINPAAPELCDGIDNDCDGDVDTNTTTVDWYRDDDDDNFGLDSDVVSSCTPVAGYSLAGGDCDDTAPAVNPIAAEICDSIDNDCDGDIDDADADVQGLPWYLDGDDDGFGLASDTVSACLQPTGYAPDSGDCDDAAFDVNPGAVEVCNGDVDDDCNLLADDADPGVTGTTAWRPDADGDTYGDNSTSEIACVPTDSSWVAAGGDCDDTLADVNPGIAELCDGIDNNCSGDIDEATATDAIDFYLDADADGYGDALVTTPGCFAPPGYSATDDDCDDADPTTYPGATEICDGIDNDCNSLIDDSAIPIDWYNDVDGDGYGDPGDTQSACTQPSGYITDNSDCNDADAAINPAADEECDSIDNDCDGDIDDADADVIDQPSWYADSDGDLFGAPGTATVACVAPANTVSDSSDCNDGDNAIFPGATEVCDSVDNDCDTLIDDADGGLSGAPDWYRDFDTDNFGDALSTVTACNPPGGYISDSADCDDGSAAVNPNATELCNGIDDNCDTNIDEDTAADAATWYADADSDAYGDAGSTTAACNQPAGFVADDTDCDDGEFTTHPTAPEICDGVDNNCNTLIDDGVVSVDWFGDGDGDGYGDPLDVQNDCQAPSGYVGNDQDCDDGDPAVNPNGTEVCNGIDDDCNGLTDANDPGVTDATDYFNDRDTDTYGDPTSLVTACASPGPSYVTDGTDCDDMDISINPGATEICGDGVDNDCDGGKGSCNGWSGDSPTSGAPIVIGEDGDDNAARGVSVGDLDRDGHEDLLVGAPFAFGYNTWGTDYNTGAAYIVRGPISGTNDLPGAADLTIRGNTGTADMRLGTSVAFASDVNLDGRPDVLLGAPRYTYTGGPCSWSGCTDYETGGAFLLSAPLANGTTNTGINANSALLRGINNNDRAGESVATGDFNNDGATDLLIGAWGHDGAPGNNSGEAYVLLGPVPQNATTVLNNAIVRGFEGSSGGERAGESVASAGDTNGDGRDDILIGAPRYSGGGAERGAVHIILGSASVAGRSLSSADATLLGDSAGDRAGMSVAGAGDVDGDGRDDLIIGAPADADGGNNAGAAYIVLGPVSGGSLATQAAAKLTGEAVNDEAGLDVASGGDGDGDGASEVLIGARGAGGGTVYLFRGPVSGSGSLSGADATFSASANNMGFGRGLGAGDFDGDTYDDVALGADLDDTGGNNAGAAFIFYSTGGL